MFEAIQKRPVFALKYCESDCEGKGKWLVLYDQVYKI